MKSISHSVWIRVCIAMALAFVPLLSMAGVVPAVGDLGYDFYDTVVNNGVKGPIGFVGGSLAIVYGVSQLFRSWMLGVMGLVAGTAALKADTITTSLGALI